MRYILHLFLPAMIALGSVGAAEARQPPNIILILTDDQGVSDVGYNGNPHLHTPNLDELASQSVMFDTFYAHPVCSPTRAALMTGRHPHRLGILDTQSGYSILSPGEVTLAEALKQAGYETGLFGKWHLGDNAPARPQDQGFDRVLTHEGGMIGMPYNPPGGRSYFDPILLDDGVERRFSGYAPDIFTDAAVAFMREQHQAGKPFFAFLPFNTPHHPLTALEDDAERYRALGLSEQTARFYAMISNIDENIGKVRTFLEHAGIAGNTIIIFLGDNGTSSLHRQDDLWEAGLRGRKTYTYENGIQVPFFMLAPMADFTPGSRDAIGVTEDIMPTLLDFLEIKTGIAFDGRSQLPIIADPETPDEIRDLFFQFHRTSAPVPFRNIAVRRGDFKLVQPVGRMPAEEFSLALARFELFNLAEDPFEKNDISARHPEIVEELKAAYSRWLGDVWDGSFKPVRTQIGGEHQNPVVLTRQDWLGGGLFDGDNGTYVLQVARSGTYRFTFHASRLLRDDRTVRIELGDTAFDRYILRSEINTRIGQIELEAGPTTLSAWINLDGERHGFERIEIELIEAAEGQTGE